LLDQPGVPRSRGPLGAGYVDGKPLGKAILDAAAGKGGGSVRYRWLNPVSGKVEPKVSFVTKVGDDVCGIGAYEPG
jgi:cytochrome c